MRRPSGVGRWPRPTQNLASAASQIIEIRVSERERGREGDPRLLLTWRFAIVAEIGHQQRLCIHNHNVIGGDTVHTAQRIDLLRTWKVQGAGYGHITEIYRILIAPNRKPFDIAQRFPLRQRECNILIPIATCQCCRSTTLIPQPGGTLIAWPGRVAHIEIGSGCDAIIVEFLDENRTGVHGIYIARDVMMQAAQGADFGAIVGIGGVTAVQQSCKWQQQQQERETTAC